MVSLDAVVDLQFDPAILFHVQNTRGVDGFFDSRAYPVPLLFTPLANIIHYATGGFEGILAVPSETQPGVVNVLTLDQNVKRALDTMTALYLIEGKETERVRTIREKIKKNFPDIKLRQPVEATYLNITPEKLRGDLCVLVRKSIAENYVEPGRLIYIRPIFGRGDKYLNGVVKAASGVMGLTHEVFLTMFPQNVERYLKTAPNQDPHGILLVWENERFPEAGIISPIRHIKSVGGYTLNGLAKNGAVLAGFDEGLITDPYGNVLEGGGENVYAVIDGKLVTPPLESSILSGTKRRLVLNIAKMLDIQYEERSFSLKELYERAEAMALSGTWMGFGAVRYLFKPTPIETNMQPDKEFHVNNPIITRISEVYDAIINDRNAPNTFTSVQISEFNKLKTEILTPINYAA